MDDIMYFIFILLTYQSQKSVSINKIKNNYVFRNIISCTEFKCT